MNNNEPFSSIVLYVVVCSGCWHGADYCARLAIGSPQRRSPVLLLLFCRAYRLCGTDLGLMSKSCQKLDSWKLQIIPRTVFIWHILNIKRIIHCSNVSATPIGQTGLEMGWFPLGNGVCVIMKKAPSDSPIWQLKKRELLLCTIIFSNHKTY